MHDPLNQGMIVRTDGKLSQCAFVLKLQPKYFKRQYIAVSCISPLASLSGSSLSSKRVDKILKTKHQYMSPPSSRLILKN